MFHAACLAALNFLTDVDEVVHQVLYTLNTRHEEPIEEARTELLDSDMDIHMMHALSSLNESTDEAIHAPAPRTQTPFYILARTAPQLHLSFVIPGYKEETLTFSVDTTDMAFLLERTLARKSWNEEHTRKSVVDFLEVPPVSVQFQGENERIGILPRSS
jgi:hypothetical protein